MKKIVLWSAGILTIAAAAFCGSFMSSRVEQAKYEVVENHGPIEIRDYVPIIIAEVEMPGDRREAIKDGFRLVADYIFGNNEANQKIEMTAPVMQQAKGDENDDGDQQQAHDMAVGEKTCKSRTSLQGLIHSRFVIIRGTWACIASHVGVRTPR